MNRRTGSAAVAGGLAALTLATNATADGWVRDIEVHVKVPADFALEIVTPDGTVEVSPVRRTKIEIAYPAGAGFARVSSRWLTASGRHLVRRSEATPF